MNDNALQLAFAQRLIQAMEEEKMSQKDLAGVLGVHPTQVLRWRKATAFPANLDTIADIGAALNRAPVWLMFGIDVGKQETELIMKLLRLQKNDREAVRTVIDAMASKDN